MGGEVLETVVAAGLDTQVIIEMLKTNLGVEVNIAQSDSASFFDDLDRYALATMMLTNRAARTGVLDGVGVGLWRSAIAFGSLGRARLSYRYMARALEAADRMSDGVEIARLKQGLTLVPFAFGGYEDAKSQAALGMELGGARRRVPREPQIDRCGCDAIGLESERRFQRVHQASQKEARPGKQHEAQRHLRRHERSPQLAPRRPVAFAAQRLEQVAA